MYRPGLYGMHNGSLRDCAASKAEHETLTRVCATLSKAELVEAMLSLPSPGVTGSTLDRVYWEHQTAKHMRELAVSKGLHAFNLRTDNYV